MKKRFIAHPQLVIFCSAILFLFFSVEILIILCMSEKNVFFILSIILNSIVIWSIVPAIYIYAYKIFELNDDGIKSGKIVIAWEEIQDVSLKEIKLFQYTFFRTRYLSSLATFTSNDGRKISFAITKKHAEWLEYFSKGKSNVINEFLNNISL